MIRAFQWDIARQVERLDWLHAQLPRYADWGYQELYLHLEDAVEYPSFPSIARKDAYRYRDLLKLVKAAENVGIKTVPIVNLLGHTQYLIKTPELRELNELRSESGSPLDSGQICPVHPRTLDVARMLLADVGPFCTAGKVHVGLDESFQLGKHPLSRDEVGRIGLAGHFAHYVNRLHALTRAAGLEMGMWADMLYFLPDAVPLLPRGITAYEWYYHAFRRHPRVELFNFAEADLSTPLLRHGLKYYGCPMNGAFRFEPMPHFGDRLGNILAWWKHNQRIGADGLLVSSWEPFRLATELTTVIDAAAAGLWLQPEVDDPQEMLVRGFERVFGKATARQAAKLAFACDRFPFSGYPRWEINSRWDTVSGREALLPYRSEVRHFGRLARAAKAAKVPAPLRASIAFRGYLAVRDVAVRELSRNPKPKS
ncbi:MAG: family 20 glycosylhydrolase, partial [Opitutus sp.]